MASGHDVYIATPCYGCRMTTAYAASLLRLQAECMQRGVSLTVQFLGNESLIQRGRNIMIEEFVQAGANHLLFLDADLAFAPTMLLDRLLPFALSHPDAIVTSIYPKKSFQWQRLLQRREDPPADDATPAEPVAMQVLEYNINAVPPAADGDAEPVENGFVQVLDSATGAMLIPRGVVLALRGAYKDTLSCVNDINVGKHPVREYVAIADCMIDPESRRYLSEDYALCRRFQAIGGKIYADLASGLCHVGTHTYHGDIRTRLRPPAAAPTPAAALQK